MKETNQLPPHAIDIEKSVLGALLVYPELAVEVMPLINSTYFYKQEYRMIFESIQNIYESGNQIDSILIVQDLMKRKVLKSVGGAGAITGLSNTVASYSMIEGYCYILKEKLMKRKQIEFGYRLLSDAYDESISVFKTNDLMHSQVNEIIDVSTVKKETTNAEIANEFIDKIHLAKENKGITGVPTGFKEHDSLLGGLQPTDLIILAARPGMGKTALVLAYFRNGVIKFGKRIIFFSLEMSAVQLFQRLCAMHMNIDSDKFKTGSLTEDEWKYFHAKLEPLLSNNMVIVDNCYTMQDIYSRTKKEKLKSGVDAVFVDYIQLIEGSGNNREQEVSKISRRLKLMAKEINAPVVALSQLSRSVETRGGDKRPMLSDLRESGAIEQDADVVEFLYRPGYYGIEDAIPGESWIIIAKSRNGALKDVQIHYNHNQTKFIDLHQTTQF